MKALLLTAITALTMTTSFAADYEVLKIDKCKTRAMTAVSIKHKKNYPDSVPHISSRSKSVLEGNQLHHFVEVFDFETQEKMSYTVTHNAQNCSILSID